MTEIVFQLVAAYLSVGDNQSF